MTIIEIQLEEKNKILKGLEKVYDKLIEFKKLKNSELVVIRGSVVLNLNFTQKGGPIIY